MKLSTGHYVIFMDERLHMQHTYIPSLGRSELCTWTMDSVRIFSLTSKTAFLISSYGRRNDPRKMAVCAKTSNSTNHEELDEHTVLLVVQFKCSLYAFNIGLVWTYKGSVNSCRQESSAPSPSSSAPASFRLPHPALFWLERWMEKRGRVVDIFRLTKERGDFVRNHMFFKNGWIWTEINVDRKTVISGFCSRDRSGYEGWIEGLCDGYKNWQTWHGLHFFHFLPTVLCHGGVEIIVSVALGKMALLWNGCNTGGKMSLAYVGLANMFGHL